MEITNRDKQEMIRELILDIMKYMLVGTVVFSWGLDWKNKKLAPINAHLEYVNNDNLPDLVYKTGEIYLQTKEGNFVPYEDVIKQEKTKIDSTYQAKADSLKRAYENKLEKGVK